jgi:Tfp pilus assembly protein PilE
MDQNPEQQTNVPVPEQPNYTQTPPQTSVSQDFQASTDALITSTYTQPPAQNIDETQSSQPIIQPQAVQQPSVSVPQKNPGLVFGIIGIILSFIFLAPVGLALSIIGTVKSHKVHTSAVVSIIGIVLNILALLGGAILLLIVLTASKGVQQRANDVTVKTNAQSVAAQAERYFSENGSYPASASELKTYANPSNDYSIVADSPTSSSTIQYVACDTDSSQVLYLMTSNSSQGIVALGNESSTTRC